jgi:protein subunit release factor B
MPISKEKQDEIKQRMERLGITEADFIEKFILGSGSGGQKINKTSSCVYLKHIPTGTEVKCQKTRSRELNRLYARREICERLEQQLFQEKSEKQQLIEKTRRQKQRKTRKQKQKMIEEKRHTSSKKTLRQSPKHSEND